MKTYTLGFIFDADMTRVALMEKTHPEWQKDKWNGIGGKVEEGELSVACMVREAREESGFETSEDDWTHVALLKAPEWAMDVYALVHHGDETQVRTTTDEPIAWHDIARLPSKTLGNVPWLVHLCCDKLLRDEFAECTLRYR